jgi:hypothetical protein
LRRRLDVQICCSLYFIVRPLSFFAEASPRCINARQQGRQQQLRVVSRAAVQTRNGRHTATGPTAAVTFKTRKQLPYGQVLKLVGSMPAMGEWDCDSAPGEDPAWRTQQHSKL